MLKSIKKLGTYNLLKIIFRFYRIDFQARNELCFFKILTKIF